MEGFDFTTPEEEELLRQQQISDMAYTPISISSMQQQPIMQNQATQLPQEDNSAMQAKALLQQLMSAKSSNPDVERQSATRQLIAGLMSSPRQRYDLGGGIVVGGDTASDRDEHARMAEWAKEPTRKYEKEQEKKRKMLDDLMKYENLKSQAEGRELTGKMTQAKINEMNAQNTPGSKLNLAEAEKTRAIIGGYQQQLQDFGTDDQGNPKIKGYVSAAKQLQELSDQAPNMTYKQLQDAQQRADKIVSAATGLAGKDISQQSTNNMDAYHRGQLDLMNKRLGQAEEKLNFDKDKFHIKTQNVNIPFNDLQKVTTTRDLLENLNSLKSRAMEMQNKLGYEGKAEDFMRDLVNQRTPEMARLMADIENMFAEPRKSRFGSAITGGDDTKMKAFVPEVKNNPGQFFAKLDSIIDTSSRTAASNIGNILRSRRIPYGGEIKPETALDDTNYILDNLLKSGTENQIPARPQSQGGASSKPATPNNAAQIQAAEKWLIDHPKDPKAPMVLEKLKKLKGQ